MDASALHMMRAGLSRWLGRRERQAIADLMEENRIIWCRAASVTFAARSRSSSITTTASGITKDSTTGASMVARCVDARDGFAEVRDLVACRITTSEPRDNAMPGASAQPKSGT